ncbi:potassium channel protein [Aurantibacter crassamenti]|uniref:potassium channel family protein n=1 Tax=Aurantibacter crassamenti TaxID=1837375 RepID=UPI00193A0772|nr:potassium channel protein [Aurantibacter crassamenti]MBM1107985.1 potassium channel protein [Aurantibacter crassamenti]
MFKLFRSKIYLAIFLLVSVMFIGLFGYHFIYDFDWLDAFYMTIITITTVGFNEVHPLGDSAKIFTVLLIITSVFIIGFAIAVITEYILGKNTLQILKKKRVKNKIKALTGHTIICGFGRNGSQAAISLANYERSFVVIEQDKSVIEKFEEDFLFVEGDANDDMVLMQAGIEKANYLIAALPEDTDNLFVVLSAKQLNQKLFIISRASQINSQKKLRLAGADKVIMPDKVGGDHMAALVVNPDLIDFMDRISNVTDGTANLEVVEIEELIGNMDCSSINDLDLRKRTGCTIIGYISPNGKYVINPGPDLKLESKSKVIVLGNPEQIKNLNQMFKIE